MTKNIPELRFPEFSGEWEEDKLLNIAPLQRGFDLPKRKIVPGEYSIGYSNGFSGTHKEFKVEGPGIITGRSGTIGKIHYINQRYWPHNTVLWVTDFFDNNSKFIYFLFKTLNFSRYSTATGVPTLNRNNLHTLDILYPKDIREQDKIATFFSLLDKRIEKQKEKLEQLIQLKKGYIQKIFSQEIRFKDEDGNNYPEWEEVELNDCIKYKRNYSFSRALEGEGKYKHIHYGDIHIKLPTLINNTDMIPSIIMEDELTIVERGDILVADASEDYEDLGKTVVINFNDSNVVAGSHVHVFSLCNTINPDFYGYFTKTDRYSRYMRKYGTGVSVLGLSKTNLSKIIIDIPKVQEQEKIASFLSLLDNRIEKQKEKLEQLNERKKGLLQKMFI